jgi:glutathione S-transferase
MTMKQPNLVLCELTDPGLDGVESYSPFCLKVHRALRAAGLHYERRHAQRPDAFRHFNPTGQVPVLLVDGEPVTDSSRILQRIDALTGAFSRGLDATQQAEAWLWEDLADTALNGFLVSARWIDASNWPLVREAFFAGAPWVVRHVIAPRLRKQVEGVLIARDVVRDGWQACRQRYALGLDRLEARAPEHGFWIGDGLTVADLGLFAQLHSFRTPLTRAQAEELAQRARLSRYLDRVDAATRGQAGARLVAA